MRTLQNIANEIEIWEGWRDNYRDFVPLFIEEAKTGNDWKNWNADIFWEYFEKSNDQCVSSVKRSYFTGEEKNRIKKNWHEVSPILQKIALSQDVPLYDSYYELKDVIKKYTDQNRKVATNRLIAGLQPNLSCTIVNEDNLKVFIKKLNENVVDCNIPITGDWFRNSNAVWHFFSENLKSSSLYENITLPWQMYEYFLNDENNDMSEIPEKRESIVTLLKYKNQIILQGPPGTGKTREAKLIAESMLELNEDEIQKSERFKIIQFHPSYTYEDFVRGIVAKPNEDSEGIMYEAENKTLGKFAENAWRNFIASQQSEKNVDNVEYIFEQFRLHIISKLAEDEKFELTNNIYISEIDDRRFKYKGDNWTRHPKGLNIRYSEFKKVIEISPSNRQEIVMNTSLKSLTRSHATYFFELFTKFKEFCENNKEFLNNEETHKKYILVIDEINRANLSSVLGELIYALEYRGEEVESMYEVDGSQKLILPPNLYIIGTMNTADRSVGHIDYAIRRRFAFVDVMPKDLTNEMKEGEFYTTLFEDVKSLFTTDHYKTKSDYISQEFEPKDVALGHSYFIDKTNQGGDQKVRWEYEIKPILLEYIRDGVLKQSALQKIKEIEESF